MIKWPLVAVWSYNTSLTAILALLKEIFSWLIFAQWHLQETGKDVWAISWVRACTMARVQIWARAPGAWVLCGASSHWLEFRRACPAKLLGGRRQPLFPPNEPPQLAIAWHHSHFTLLFLHLKSSRGRPRSTTPGLGFVHLIAQNKDRLCLLRSKVNIESCD